MCNPHNPTPMSAIHGDGDSARIASAMISTTRPAARSPRVSTRSARRPAGYDDAAYTTPISAIVAGPHNGLASNCATRSTRNASENRASVNTVPSPTITQYVREKSRMSLQRTRLAFGATCASGSRTINNKTIQAAMAGTTAHHNASRIPIAAPNTPARSAIAVSGPNTPPSMSIDCRKPYAAPRWAGGVTSATSASRGAPRIPLPRRSRKRAANTSSAPLASGNIGRVRIANP